MDRTRTENDLATRVDTIDTATLLLCEFNACRTNFAAYCFGDDLVNMGSNDNPEIGPCQNVIRQIRCFRRYAFARFVNVSHFGSLLAQVMAFLLNSLLICFNCVRRLGGKEKNGRTHPINTASAFSGVEVGFEGDSNFNGRLNECTSLLGAGSEISNFHWTIGTTNCGIDVGKIRMWDESLELLEVPTAKVRKT